MIIKAIDTYFLEGLPLVKFKLIRKYLSNYSEMCKGRMKRPPNVIRSMRERPEDKVTYAISTIEYLEPQLIPDGEAPTEEEPTGTVNIFFRRIGGQRKVTIDTYENRSIPAIFLNGYQYVFIDYIYNTNYIFEKPIRNV